MDSNNQASTPGELTIDKGTTKLTFSWDWHKAFSDLSLWSLLASNIIAIYLFNKNHVAVHDILMIYWFQSVIIGLVNFARILLLKNFSTANVSQDGHPVTSTRKTKITFAFFFLFHYGMFHLVYFMFIVGGSQAQSALPIDWASIYSISSIFLASHVFSFIYNFKQQTEGQNIGTVLFSPYARIIPMHIALIVGAFSTFALLNVFLVLKAIMDLLGHGVKHAVPNVIE